MKTKTLEDGTLVIGIPDRIEYDIEPTVEISCGDKKVRLTLTYWNHLVQCGGWGDEKTTPDFGAQDGVLARAAEDILKELWKQSDAILDGKVK